MKKLSVAVVNSPLTSHHQRCLSPQFIWHILKMKKQSQALAERLQRLISWLHTRSKAKFYSIFLLFE